MDFSFRASVLAALLRTAQGLLLALAVLAQATPRAQGREPLSLEEAQRIAQIQSPQLAAQSAAVSAAQRLIVSAGQLPDPKLELGVQNLPVDTSEALSLTRDFMTMRTIGLIQDFPRKEKRRSLEERAVAETGKEQATLELQQRNLRRDVALAWLDRYFAGRQVQILKGLEAEVALLYDAARAALAGGKGTVADPILARAARVQVQDRIQDAERQVRRTQAMLARWVGERDAARALGAPPAFDTVAHPPAEVQEVVAHHPELLVYGPMEDMARADIALAKAAKIPDWSLEATYGARGPGFSNLLTLLLRIDLPVFGEKRQDPVIAARYKALEQLESQREDARRMHLAELEGMYADWDTARARRNRYERELVPLSREGAAAALAAYRSGRGTLQGALDARRSAIETLIMEVQTQAELGRAWAYLNFLLPEHGTAGEGK
jgi:outer membrane protein TolC